MADRTLKYKICGVRGRVQESGVKKSHERRELAQEVNTLAEEVKACREFWENTVSRRKQNQRRDA